jgi:hypothetical protein
VESEKEEMVNKKIIFKSLIFILLLTSYFLPPTSSHSKVLERIVAIVNNDVILLSEFEEAFQAAKKSDEKVTEGKVLDEMINRLLFLEQAKKFRLGTAGDSAGTMDDDKIISEYVDRRIKSFIHIPIDEIESYYVHNREQYGGKPFYEVKDEIEEHLIEGEMKIKLAEHVAELRKKAYIRIQINPS